MLARERIRSFVRQTPLLTSASLNHLTGARLYFKAEHLQITGAFKYRGACNAILQLTDDEKHRGVATHSSGNHGAALARAADAFHLPATIVMPDNATKAKRQAVLAYGGRVVECAPGLPARESTLAQVVTETNAAVIPPYDDYRVICGQGTIGLELAEQLPRDQMPDAIVAPVGGGGLVSGLCLALKTAGHAVSIYGAEPEMADDAWRSLQTGERVRSHEPRTIAEGLQTVLGERNFAIMQQYLDDVLLVSESEIITAMQLIWTRMKQVIEPSSAVTLAAVCRYPELFRDKRVVLVLTGGNVDINDLPWSR